jgi:hypothetical protein
MLYCLTRKKVIKVDQRIVESVENLMPLRLKFQKLSILIHLQRRHQLRNLRPKENQIK